MRRSLVGPKTIPARLRRRRRTCSGIVCTICARFQKDSMTSHVLPIHARQPNANNQTAAGGPRSQKPEIRSGFGLVSSFGFRVWKQVGERTTYFPSRRARPLQSRVHCVEQCSFPMFFQDAPATFDGVVLTTVRPIAYEHDLQIIPVCKLLFHHHVHRRLVRDSENPGKAEALAG